MLKSEFVIMCSRESLAKFSGAQAKSTNLTEPALRKLVVIPLGRYNIYMTLGLKRKR